MVSATQEKQFLNTNPKLNKSKKSSAEKLNLSKLEAIEVQNYELAGLWRDKLGVLDEVVSNQQIILPQPQNIDIITIISETDTDGFGLGSVFVQNIREGKMINVNNFLLSGNGDREAESLDKSVDSATITSPSINSILQSFLLNYYGAKIQTDKIDILLQVWEM
jgi:excinuclease UvrABC nuclease subunit